MKREEERMDYIKITKQNRMEAEVFLQELSHVTVEDEALIDHGYLIKSARKTVGFFMLQPFEDNSVCLRKFIISQVKEPAIILAMIELAIDAARNIPVDKLIVNANRPVLEELLSQLGFRRTSNDLLKENSSSTAWEYVVDNMADYPQS